MSPARIKHCYVILYSSWHVWFYPNLEFLDRFFVKVPSMEFHETSSIGSCAAACGQTDRQTDMTKLIGTLCGYANPLNRMYSKWNKCLRWIRVCCLYDNTIPHGRLTFVPWKWRRYVLPKRWYLSYHSAARNVSNSATSTGTAVRTSYLRTAWVANYGYSRTAVVRDERNRHCLELLKVRTTRITTTWNNRVLHVVIHRRY